MSIHKRKQDGRWFAVFLDESGKQRKKIFGPGSEGKKEAQAFDLRLKADRKEGIKPVVKQQMFLNELAQKYLDERRTFGHVSTGYINTIKSLLNVHIGRPLNAKPVDRLTYGDLVKAMEVYKDRSPSTMQRYLGYLRAIFNFGIAHGHTTNNPLKLWHKVKEPPRRSQLTVVDLKRILSVSPDHLRWALTVQFYLGTRPGPSELFSIRWQDIDFERNLVHVLSTKTKNKTKAWRTVSISRRFKPLLLERQKTAQSEFLIEYKGKPVKQFRRSFQTALKRAGITYPCCLYDLRHMFASLILSGGGDLAAVSLSLGHSQIEQTTDAYYDLMAGEKERAVNLLPSLFDDEPEEPVDDNRPQVAVGNVIPFRPRRTAAA